MAKLLLRALQLHVPRWVKKVALQELFVCSAAGFGCQAPRLDGLSYAECLEKYARFTAERALQAIEQGREVAARERLYSEAFRLGQRARRWLRVSTMEEAMAAASVLYSTLRIDLQGTGEGEIIVRRCYFSQFYSVPICQVISGLDAGVLAGLSGGKQLTFSERITEGAEWCRARLGRVGTCASSVRAYRLEEGTR